MTQTLEKAIFAGGCFWCMVEPFEEKEGILSVRSGYTAGHTENPTYEQVCSKQTGHTEAVEIIFDSSQVTYKELLDLYWQMTDPTDAMGQFEDRGDNYRPVIFYLNQSQKELAEQSKKELAQANIFDAPIVTTIEEAQPFYPAEEYHQAFYRKNPERYAQSSKIRHDFLERTWQNKEKR